MMKTQDIDKKIGMPDIDKEWAKFKANVIDRKSHSVWTLGRVAAVAAIVFTLGAASAVAIHVNKTQTPVEDPAEKQETKPMVEHVSNPGARLKRMSSYYRVNLCEGTYIEIDSKGHREEEYFTYTFPDATCTVNMQLDGKPFDKDHLPKLTNKDLKAVIVTKKGDSQTVNLLTTHPAAMAYAMGNVPRELTLLLPGNGELYLVKKKAQRGDWLHSSIGVWERDQFGYRTTDEFERPKKKPGFKAYIYASTEAPQADIDRAKAMMDEMKISNYEVVTGIPIRHYTDSELRQWAADQKAKGTPYESLFDVMAPNGMAVSDVRRQWHIVKKVYGRK